MTVREILELYRRVYMKTNLKPTTYRSYSVNIDNHLIPYIGDKDPETLTCFDIDDLVANIATERINNTTIAYALRVLKQALRFAQRRQYIRVNIMDSYDMPKKSSFTYTILTADQMDSLLAYLKETGSDIYFAVLMAAWYGLRRGECMGLMSSDILENVCSVRRTTHFEHGDFQTTSCKTEKSKRDILLSDLHLQEIREYDRVRAKNREGYVLRDFEGNRITQNMLQLRYKAALEALELPRVRFHDLRHSYATVMLRNGVNPKIVSSVLGHSSIGITMDLYSHADISMQKACLDVMEKHLPNNG